jgi:hypothetical protein
MSANQADCILLNFSSAYGLFMGSAVLRQIRGLCHDSTGS